MDTERVVNDLRLNDAAHMPNVRREWMKYQPVLPERYLASAVDFQIL